MNAWGLCTAGLLAALLVSNAFAGEPRRTRAQSAAETPSPPAPVVIRTVKLRDDVFVLLGAGANITAHVGDEGILLVNAGSAGTTEAVLGALAKITDRPLRLILNTSADAHHTGGNEGLYRAGRAIGDRAELNHALISAHEAVLNRMSAPQGQQASAPESAWPTDVLFTESMEFYFNGEGVVMEHMPAAHSDGDTIVHFRKADVVSAGDIFLQHSYPVIHLDQGGTINGVIAALNRLIDIAIPAGNQEGGTMIVPGDGRPSDEYEVVIYRDMVTIFRDRVLDLKAQGMTLNQVKAARPTREYDARYAHPDWTADRFVEAIYLSLDTAPATARAGE